MSDEATIFMAYALVADKWGTCIIVTTRLVVLANFNLSQKTEPNRSEYRLDYPVRQERF